MLIGSDAMTLSADPRKVLEGKRARLERFGGIETAESRSLEAEVALWEAAADRELIAKWEGVHASYWRHKRVIEEHTRSVEETAEAMRELAPSYSAAVRREQARFDAEADGAPA
jgi:hypothetical protein